MAAEIKTTSWSEVRARRPSPAAGEAAADEARIAAFRELVYQLRHDAGLTQAELADRMAPPSRPSHAWKAAVPPGST